MSKKITTYLRENGRRREVTFQVPDDEPRRWGADELLRVVGQPIRRVDALEKVTGRARYTYDIELPGMLYGKILRCPHPRAKVISLDLRPAKKMRGIKAAIAWKEEALFAGEEVAAVAGVTKDIAEDAIHHIRVEYDVLPFVVDQDQAKNSRAPRVREEGNTQGPQIYARGDIQDGFASADLIVEATYTTPVVIHVPLETHGSVAQWNGDELTVWDSTQAVFSVRDALAQAFEMPKSKVRVIKEHTGGAFGSKLWMRDYTVIAAKLARQAGRPVKLMLSREEDFLCTGNRPSSVQQLRVGATRDGTLTALHLRSYGTAGITGGAGCSWPIRGIYRCENVKTEETDVFTNAGPACPFRAPGFVQGSFALESILDELAEKLEMDPLELRKKNYAEVDPVQGLPYSIKALAEEYEVGAKAFDWKRKWQPAHVKKGTSRRGVGLGTAMWFGAGAPPCHVEAVIRSDGSVTISCGTQDIGTATRTIMAQIAAEELGLDVGEIEVDIGDTESELYAPSSGGSQTAATVTPATRVALTNARNQLFEVLASKLGVASESLAIGDHRVLVGDDPSKSLAWADATRHLGRDIIVALGSRAPNPEGFSYRTFGAQFAEVEVDTETGQVQVLKIVSAQDCGRAINPLTVQGQIKGGIVQGLSYALLEERIMDREKGLMLNANLEDYKIAGSLEMPEIDSIIVDATDPIVNNVGAKGIGEPPIIPTAGAIANAVANAIGVRIRDLPLTPDKILMALEQQEKRAG